MLTTAMTYVDVKNGEGMSVNTTRLTFWFLPPFAQPVSSNFHSLQSLPLADSDQTAGTNEAERKPNVHIRQNVQLILKSAQMLTSINLDLGF